MYTSSGFTPTALGTYHWIATYTGDANNDAVTTSCGDTGETLMVNSKANPSITTSLSTSSIFVGGGATDSATLSGGVSPVGTITFTVYRDACIGSAVFANTKIVSGNGVYTSDPFLPSGGGIYHWIASYSGDANNNGYTTSCGDSTEILFVSSLGGGGGGRHMPM